MKITNDCIFACYMGELVQVPKDSKYMAVDQFGYLVVFPEKPTSECGYWGVDGARAGRVVSGVSVDLSSSDMRWTESLRPVKREVVRVEDLLVEAVHYRPTRWVRFHNVPVAAPETHTYFSVGRDGSLWSSESPIVFGEADIPVGTGAYLLVKFKDYPFPSGHLSAEIPLEG